MKDRHWRTLVHNIQNKRCILVLGPDVARSTSKEQKPLAQILANEFAEEVGEERKVPNPDDLAYTAQMYGEMTSESDLQLDTANFYKKSSVVTEIYKKLADIPFHLVVNATPDIMLIEAMKKAKKKYDVDWYNFRGKKRDMAQWNAKENQLIYYLYGCIKEPESLVISEKHLLEFLTAVISKEPALQSNIISEFRHKENCFLFLGFGFRNWYLRILLYVMLGGKEGQTEKTSPSFALEDILPGDATNIQEIRVLFNKKLKIDFSEMSTEEFVSELCERYKAEVAASLDDSGIIKVPNYDEVADDAPTVFLCHASEDKETALAIHKELKAGGLNPWIDKEGIRSGDQWDRLLQKTISEVDYFMVLQSKALAAKTIGYVNKEIKIAIERQQQYRFGIKFILPAKIDDCEILEELDFIQSIDLTDMSNISRLLKDIRRDQERRKK